MKHIHLIGVAGTGMGAFAGLLKQAGYRVSGSDTNTYPPMKDKLKEWGIEVHTPYSADNLKDGPDWVIVGNVVTKDNVEAVYAREQNLPYTSFPSALSEIFLSKAKPVVVTGTHGKTTTCALLAYTLYQAGRDPSFLVGGIPQNWGESFRLGNWDAKTPFVVEGDEYDTAYFDKGPKFLHYRPFYLLSTSLEYDHADIYKNVEEIRDRFSQLFALVPPEGTLVIHAKAPHLKSALQAAQVKANVKTYGPSGEYEAKEVSFGEWGVRFKVSRLGEELGDIELPLTGWHNVENALGAYVILESIGLNHSEIKAGYASFKGVKRRMEEKGEARGILVIDDFAHHPTAVATTIEGARLRYPHRPLWALFEPRSATSCRKVFQEAYSESFSKADRVLLAPTGRVLDPSISLDVHGLTADINAKGILAHNYESIDDMVEVVRKEAPQGALLLCMSNGGFGGIHEKLLKAL